MALGSGLRAQGSGLRAQGAGLRAQGKKENHHVNQCSSLPTGSVILHNKGNNSI
jgi:hypothetical protein